VFRDALLNISTSKHLTQTATLREFANFVKISCAPHNFVPSVAVSSIHTKCNNFSKSLNNFLGCELSVPSACTDETNQAPPRAPCNELYPHMTSRRSKQKSKCVRNSCAKIHGDTNFSSTTLNKIRTL
jgi:hypothetical protein